MYQILEPCSPLWIEKIKEGMGYKCVHTGNEPVSLRPEKDDDEWFCEGCNEDKGCTSEELSRRRL